MKLNAVSITACNPTIPTLPCFHRQDMHSTGGEIVTYGCEGEVVGQDGREEEGGESEEDRSEEKLIHFVRRRLDSIAKDVEFLAYSILC